MDAIGSFANSTVALVVVLGIIIFFHESGHFLLAKAFGMRVFIFSFGFGKRLFGFRRGDTDYRVSLIPLGGYVKLEGEADDLISENVPVNGGGDHFTSRPRWQRLLVYVAGPAMNAVLAVLVFWIMFVIGAPVPGMLVEPPVIGDIDRGGPADLAGFEPADLIVAVDGDRVADWQSTFVAIGVRPGRTVDVVVRRDGSERKLTVKPARHERSFGDIGVSPLVRVGLVTEGGPAAEAGLRPDDGILAVGGKRLRSFGEIPQILGATGDVAISFDLVRGDSRLSLVITPKRGRIGIGNHLIPRRFPVDVAFKEALKESWSQTVQMLQLLKRVLTARVSPGSAFSGPIDIGRAAGEAARRGPVEYLQLMSLLSISVGVLNLFPLAPLDGGHMAILMAEMVIRRDLSEKAKIVFMNVGFVLIMSLMVFILYSDLSKIPWLSRFLP